MNQPDVFVYTGLGLPAVELPPTEWGVGAALERDGGVGTTLIGIVLQTEAGFEVARSRRHCPS